VPAGEPVTYAQYAALTGRATAVRAAAAACARNAAALFVPCHRVVRTDGTLGGFRWGLEVKRRLLDREAAARGLAPAASPTASGPRRPSSPDPSARRAPFPPSAQLTTQ
jgi:O-6-methylguanine DNA methyltransferase